MILFEDISKNPEIRAYIEAADASLSALGYTEHSFAHVGKVAHMAAELLSALGYREREVELVKIAGFVHDIGNLVNRDAHSQSGAIMAFRILRDMGMEPSEVAKIVTAIGNHDEGVAFPFRLLRRRLFWRTSPTFAAAESETPIHTASIYMTG